jgi:hypothetical protein
VTTASRRSPDTNTESNADFTILKEFLLARRIDLTEGPSLDGIAKAFFVQDEHALVVNYIMLDAIEESQSSAEEPEWLDYIRSLNLEPQRTDLVLTQRCARSLPRIRRSAQPYVRRSLLFHEFLDSFLRPKSICSELLEPKQPSNTEPFDPSSDAELLEEADFIAQNAIVGESTQVVAMERLFGGWALGETPRLCVLIAPAGHGKSKLTHVLAKRLARYYEDSDPEDMPPLPILIAFGKYRRGSSEFGGLILSALDRFGHNLLTVEAFQYLVSLGRVLFILDGYDEMVEADPATARDNVANFIREAGPRSRILLTARSTFYRTGTDVVVGLNDPLVTEEDVEVIDLEPFTLFQAKEYLTKRLAKVQQNNQTMERAQTILDQPGAIEVFGSPIFLSEFASSIATDRWSITDVRERGGLEFLIERAFSRERLRQDHSFSDDVQRRFLEGIALDMLATGTHGYAREDLEVFVAEAVQEESGVDDWQLLASHHFLLPVEMGNTHLVTMKHQVWREYFQGTALAALVRTSAGEAARRLCKDMPEGVLRTFAASLSEGEASTLAQSVETSPPFTRNIVKLMLARSASSPRGVFPDNVSLRQKDLSGLRFEASDLRSADFSDSDLTDVRFVDCDLRGTSFGRAFVNRTSIRSCELGVDLLQADIVSVTIDNETFFGPMLAARWQPEERPAETSEKEESVVNWVVGILRERLSRFVKRRPGNAESFVFDESISWIGFMGGARPGDRDFISRRLFHALYSEGIVEQVPSRTGSRPPVYLTRDPIVRAEILEMMEGAELGPRLMDVVRRVI